MYGTTHMRPYAIGDLLGKIPYQQPYKSEYRLSQKVSQYVRRKQTKVENYKNIFTQLNISNRKNDVIMKNAIKKNGFFNFSNPNIFNSNFL